MGYLQRLRARYQQKKKVPFRRRLIRGAAAIAVGGLLITGLIYGNSQFDSMKPECEPIIPNVCLVGWEKPIALGTENNSDGSKTAWIKFRTTNRTDEKPKWEPITVRYEGEVPVQITGRFDIEGGIGTWTCDTREMETPIRVADISVFHRLTVVGCENETIKDNRPLVEQGLVRGVIGALKGFIGIFSRDRIKDQNVSIRNNVVPAQSSPSRAAPWF